MRHKAEGAAQGTLPGLEVERPVARPNIEGMFSVPALQALVMGVGTGVVLSWLLVDVARWVPSWWPFSLVLVLVCFLLAFWLRMGAAENTLWSVERVIGLHLNRDRAIGDPSDHDHIIVVNRRRDLPSEEERKRQRFIQFIMAVERTKDATYEKWEPILGRDLYLEFRDGLLDSGYAEWNDPRNRKLSWHLTAPAAVIIQEVM